MILKSMSRKGSAAVHFPQLYDYISRDAERGEQFWHNFMHHEPDRATTVKGFKDNARHIKQDQRHNVLYHEIISLTRHPRSQVSRQIAALRELARSYLEQRAPQQLAYGAIHLDKDHSVHLHLMISSNGIGSNKRVRLSKADFREIQKKIENQLQRNYPELQEERIYTREKGTQNKRQKLKQQVEKVLERASSFEKAQQLFAKEGIELVKRGETITAIDGSTRLRLTPEQRDRIAKDKTPVQDFFNKRSHSDSRRDRADDFFS